MKRLGQKRVKEINKSITTDKKGFKQKFRVFMVKDKRIT